MNLSIQTTLVEALDQYTIDEVCAIAAEGFGQPNSPAMQEDTLNHLRAAETLQLAYINQGLVGFSMYRNSLWRQCT